jgi:hypothetical protein
MEETKIEYDCYDYSYCYIEKKYKCNFICNRQNENCIDSNVFQCVYCGKITNITEEKQNQ